MSMGILYIIAGAQEYFRRNIWFKAQYLIIVKILLAIIVFTACLFGSMNGERVYVNADEWDNPVEYYNKYGNNAVFKADGKTKGEIYFCSVGNTSNSGTKYKTIGLKIAETGDYDNKKIKSKDRKRIEITKKSYIYLIIIVLACLILDYLLKIV